MTLQNIDGILMTELGARLMIQGDYSAASIQGPRKDLSNEGIDN